MTKYFIIDLVIYPFDLMISIGETDDQLIKRFKKLNIEFDDELKFEENGRGRTGLLESGQGIIRLKKHPRTNEDYGTLQHEIFHYVQFLMDRFKMPLNMDTCEAYAYLIGYLTTEIYKKL